MAFGVTLRAPHGGIFVFFAIGNLLWFLVALIAGTVVAAFAVIAAKQFIKPGAKAECPSSSPPDPIHPPPPPQRRTPCPPRPSSSARPSDCTPGPRRSSPRPSSTPVSPSPCRVDGGEAVDAGSALMIMTLGAGNGAQVTVVSDDEAALNTVAELVQQDLDA